MCHKRRRTTKEKNKTSREGKESTLKDAEAEKKMIETLHLKSTNHFHEKAFAKENRRNERTTP